MGVEANAPCRARPGGALINPLNRNPANHPSCTSRVMPGGLQPPGMTRLVHEDVAFWARSSGRISAPPGAGALHRLIRKLRPGRKRTIGARKQIASAHSQLHSPTRADSTTVSGGSARSASVDGAHWVPNGGQPETRRSKIGAIVRSYWCEAGGSRPRARGTCTALGPPTAAAAVPTVRCEKRPWCPNRCLIPNELPKGAISTD